MQNKYYTGKRAAVLWFSIVRRYVGFSQDVLSAHAALLKLSLSTPEYTTVSLYCWGSRAATGFLYMGLEGKNPPAILSLLCYYFSYTHCIHTECK